MRGKGRATLILDNGGSTMKVGYSDEQQARTIPNSIVKSKNDRFRVFVSDQIENLKARNGLFYQLPYQRGLLTRYDLQLQIWDQLFETLKVEPTDTTLMVTEPHFNIPKCRHTLWEVLFEDYGFASVYCAPATLLSAYKYASQNVDQRGCLMVDSGYSSTYVAPFYEGNFIKDATSRIDVGGKILTNYLKEVITYRQVNVLEETYIMNKCKEDVCFVSQDLKGDMEESQKSWSANSILRHYVLPDFVKRLEGSVHSKEDAPLTANDEYLTVNRERFTVPELLFSPSIAGTHQMGLAELIAYVVLERCPKNSVAALLNNIVLTGGNCCFAGFKERLYNELRSMVPEEYEIRIALAEDPIRNAWKGGQMLSNAQCMQELVVRKDQYDEYGAAVCETKFIN